MEVRVRVVDVAGARARGRRIEIDLHPRLVGEVAGEPARDREADRAAIDDRRPRVGEVRQVAGCRRRARGCRRAGRIEVTRDEADRVEWTLARVAVAIEGDPADEQVPLAVEADHRIAGSVETEERRGLSGGRRVGREPGHHRLEAVRERRCARPRGPAVERQVDRHPCVGGVRHHPVVVCGFRDDVADLAGDRRGLPIVDRDRRLVRLAVLCVLARRDVPEPAVDIVVVVGDLDVGPYDRMAPEHARREHERACEERGYQGQ